MAVIAGYEASLHYINTDTVSVALTAEPMEALDAARTLWRVADRTKRWLDPLATTTVKVDGLEADATVCYAGGFARFAEGVAAGSLVTIDGKCFDHTTVNKLGGAKQWGLDLQSDEYDVTSWDSGKWREFINILKGATVTFDRWWLDALFILYLQDITPTSLIGLEMRAAADYRYYAYGHLTSDAIKMAVDGVAEESISVRVTGPVEYTEE